MLPQIEHKEIALPGNRYLVVPVATRPAAIPARDWDRLARINDHIIDSVTYDHLRARADSRVVQTPQETLRRGRGVCSDYSALFESMARIQGYRVRSMRSRALNHAWNTVHLGGVWWIVDVTWNDGEIFNDGRPIPHAARLDPDFRRKYFLTTPQREAALRKAGLIHQTHATSDAEPVDYEQSFAARAIVDQIGPLITERNAILDRQRRLIEARNRLVAQHNALVGQYNSRRTAAEQQTDRPRLDRLRAELDRTAVPIAELGAQAEQLKARYEALYARFRAIADQHPLNFTYRLG